MKIKFLGTSAGWPLPRLGCSCRVCSSNDPRDSRTRSQALVNEILLLDIGPDTYHHLKQPAVDATKIKYAAVSHEHPDHTLGLWDLSHIYLADKYNQHFHNEKIKIIINQSTLSKIRNLFFPNEYEILLANPGKKVEADNFIINLLLLNHTDSTFGILIEEGRKKFFWAPDFKSMPSETLRVLEGIDSLAIDGSELKIKTAGHETIEEGLKLGRGTKAKNVYFVHIGHRTLPHKDLESYVKKNGGNNFHVAYDGLEIEI